MIFCVAAPLGQELSDSFMEHHPNVKYIVQGYFYHTLLDIFHHF